MKKNMVSIIILALLIVNIVLTAIMMFSVTSASKKTAALVDNIATALDLELTAANGGEEEVVSVPMTDTEIYEISESMTIPLKTSEEDGKDHYCLVSVALSINTKDDGYKTYGSDLSGQESLIKSEINNVFSQYTMEEAKNSQEQIRQEILERIQAIFDSEFIFNVSFSDIMFQ